MIWQKRINLGVSICVNDHPHICQCAINVSQNLHLKSSIKIRTCHDTQPAPPHRRTEPCNPRCRLRRLRRSNRYHSCSCRARTATTAEISYTLRPFSKPPFSKSPLCIIRGLVTAVGCIRERGKMPRLFYRRVSELMPWQTHPLRELRPPANPASPPSCARRLLCTRPCRPSSTPSS